MKSIQPWAKTFYSEYLIKQSLGVTTSTSNGKQVELAEFREKDKDFTSLDEGWTTISGIDNGWHGGLGQIYKYPGDPKRLRDRYKTRLWKEYFERKGVLPRPS